MLPEKQTTPQASLLPNYWNAAYWKHVMECGDAAQNTVNYF